MKMNKPFNVKNNLSITFILFFLFFYFFISCNSTYTSKRQGYYKIEFPQRQYIKFGKQGFPYSFEYPAYAIIDNDSLYSNQKGSDPYSINIDFPSLNGKIYMTYKV